MAGSAVDWPTAWDGRAGLDWARGDGLGARRWTGRAGMGREHGDGPSAERAKAQEWGRTAWGQMDDREAATPSG